MRELKLLGLIIYWLLLTTPLGLLRAVAIPLSWPVILIALFFVEDRLSNSKKRERYIVVLPDWAWWCSNDHDGCDGDARDYFGSKWWWLPAYFRRFIWLGFRNPVNNLRFTNLYQCDLNECGTIRYFGDPWVSDRINQAGLVLTYTRRPGSKLLYIGVYWVWMWTPEELRCLRYRWGFKIDTWDQGEAVGFTTTLNPFKRVHGHLGTS